MSSITSIDNLILKLRNRTEPLTTEQCVNLSIWLEKYVQEHDEQLINEAFIKVHLTNETKML